MNKYLIAVVMVVLVAVGYTQRGEAQPTHICSTNASTYQDLVDLGFCDIGDKTFSNFNGFFTTTTGGAIPVLASNVAVTSLSGPPFWGFNFAFTLAAGPSQHNEIEIAYTITCNPLADVFNCIDSNELALTSTVMGGGTAGVVAFGLLVDAGSPSAAASFAGVHSEDVLESIDVFCPANPNCLAQISAVSNTVDQVQVPEPATLPLLGAGLFSLAALGRRKSSR
jgi:hypothetical protein